MNRVRRQVLPAVAAVALLAAGAFAATPIPQKNHSFDVLAGATVCSDGAIFTGQATAASAFNLNHVSEVWDAAGAVLLGSGDSHNFTFLNETHVFTVMTPLTVGATVRLVVSSNPGSNAPLGGLEGDTRTATVADCSLPVAPALPGGGTALLALLLAAGGAWTMARVSRSSVGRGAIGAALVLALAASAAVATEVSTPLFDKGFDPDTIGPGSTSMLIFVIDNTVNPSYPVANLAFSDTLPSGMSLAAPALSSNSCGGTLVAPDGGTTVTFSGGMVGAGAICTVVVNVIGTTDCEEGCANTSGDLTSDAGNSGSASATLFIDTGIPGFSKSFAPNPVEFGARSTLTFTIDNSLNASFEGFLTFTDTLPAGMVIASPSNKATTCGSPPTLTPTLTAVSGTDEISFFVSGGTAMFPAVSAGSTCTVTVDVVGGAVGDLGNVSDNLGVTGDEFVGKASAVLEVTGFATQLQLTKEFTDDPVAPGEVVTLAFKITNKNRDDPATAITFSDTIDPLGALSPGLAPAEALPKAACGGTLSFAGGALTLSGGSLPAEGMCTFTVALAVPLGATPGSYANTTTAVSGTILGETETGNIAGDLLFIDHFPVLTKEFTDDPVGAGGTVMLEFTIRNSNSGSELMDIAFTDDLGTAIPTNDEGEPGLAANSLVDGDTDDPIFDICGMGSKLTVFNPPDIVFGMITIITPPDPSILEFTGGSLAEAGMMGDTCTFSIPIDVRTGVAGGVYTNTTEEITGEFTGPTPTTGPPASGDLIVVGAPTLGKSFTDDPVAPGGSVTLEFNLALAPEAAGSATGIAFTDDLTTWAPPVAGVTATAVGPPTPTIPLTPTCDGTVDITTDPTVIDYSGGSLAPGGKCGFTVTLSIPAAATPGFKTNTSSGPTATVGGVPAEGSPAKDKVLISGFRLEKEFTDDPVIAGDTATLKFTLDNSLGTVAATAIAFDDELDDVIDGMVPVAPPAAPCGGTLVVTGSSKLEFTGGSVSAGFSCDFDVTVLVPATIDPPGPEPPIPTPDGGYPNSTEAESVTVGATTFEPDPAVDAIEVDSTLLEIDKEFLGDPVAPGGTVSLEFTITNISATETVTDIAFSDDLGAALTGLTATAAPVNDCGGMGSGFPTTMFSYSGGGPLLPGASCTILLTVTVPAAPLADPEPFVNETSEVTGKVGLLDVFGGTAEDELLVQLLAISKEFTDDPTTAGGTVTLEFTLTNLGTDPVSNLAFTDDLSAVLAGLTATTPLPPVGVCGPGSAITGTTFLTFTGGSLPAGPGTFCVIAVTLSVPASAPDGVFVNRTSRLREAGIPVAPRAQALLEIEPPPVFSKSFSPDPVGQGFETTLTFTIDNTASVVAATDLDFLDMLPIGLEVAPAPMPTNTCGGALVAPAGGVSISLSGGTVGAGATCTLSVKVRATGVGLLTNTSGDLTSSSGNSGAASDSVTVIGCLAADGANFTIENDVILAPEIVAVCNTIQVKQHVLVLGPDGLLDLTAGVAVIFFNGFEVAEDGEMKVTIDPSLIP